MQKQVCYSTLAILLKAFSCASLYDAIRLVILQVHGAKIWKLEVTFKSWHELTYVFENKSDIYNS